MANVHIETIKNHVISLLQEQIDNLRQQRTEFLSGKQSTGKYALLDILDGLDGSTYALRCLASRIAKLEGSDLNYEQLTDKIRDEFCFKRDVFDETWNVFARSREHIGSIRANQTAMVFLKHLNNLMYNILVDVESRIENEITRFEANKIGLAIVVHSDTQSCINFLIDELAKRKDGGKREFLRELGKELHAQKGDFFHAEEELLLEHLKFYKCEPNSNNENYFKLEHINYRTLETWINDRLRVLAPKLILKEGQSPGLKQRVAKFLTSREFNGTPIITAQPGHPTDAIFDSAAFSNHHYYVNHPGLLIATIAWLHQNKLIFGITEAQDWLVQFGFIGKGKYCCDKTCWNRLSRRKPTWSRKELAKWDVDLAAILAVENKNNVRNGSISIPLSGFSKKFAVVDSKTRCNTKFTQRMN